MDPLSVEAIIQRADRLKGDRATTETHWQEVADYLMPSREFTTTQSPGEKRTALIYHTGPVMAAEQMAGALHGMLTSPALRWFTLRPDDDALAQDQEARGWFEEQTGRMYRKLTSPATRFDLHLHENYLDQAGFGNSVLFMPDRGRAGIGFKSLPLSECYLSENDDGDMDVLFRCFSMRCVDVVEKWGKDVPEDMRREVEKNPDRRWECIHAIQPDPKRKGGWVGQYILKRGKSALGKPERYEDKPFVAPRWSKRSGEMYGAGPGMAALPDVKMLNKLEEEHLRGVMLANAPPLALPDDGFLSALSQQPRALNYYRNEMQGYEDRVFPIQLGARPDIAAEKIAGVEQRVATAFYIQWMNLPFRPNMTATEVIQRRDEMLRLMGPMVARLQAELLGPVINRVFNVMWRNGELSPPPSILSGAKWHVEYMSPLAVAQKASDASVVLNYVSAIGQIAAGDPTIMDRLDVDEIAEVLADRMGAPAKILRNDDAVAQLRQARQEREAVMQNAMAADAATKMLHQGGAGIKSLADAGAAGMAAEAA